MSRPVLNGLDLNNKNITSLADGVSATDAVTKQQLDAAIRGLDWKQSVRAASTANVTVASALINGLTMDGVTLATGDRVLLMNQTTTSENGIYVVVASGAASRATDADASIEVTSGMAVPVTEGTVNGDKTFVLGTNDPITLGTTGLSFAALGGGGSSGYNLIQAAGSGLTARTTLNFLAGMTAVDNSGSTRTDVGVDSAVFVRKFSADCVVTTNPQTFTHSLGTKDVVVQVRRNSDDVLCETDIVSTSTTAISVNFGGAPSAAQYRVTVLV